MQKRIVLCCLVGIAVITNIIRLSYQSKSEIRPLLQTHRGRRDIRNHTEKDKHVSVVVKNDGPTILGSKTVFEVSVLTSSQARLAYQWGTYVPRQWKTLYSYNKQQECVIDWWTSTGSKTAYFFIDREDGDSSGWKRIAQNQSSVDVIDYLSFSIAIQQDEKSITDGILYLGLAKFTAKIHDPGHYFNNTVVKYSWIFSGGSSTQVTTRNSIENTFKIEGLFVLQVFVSLIKSGKSYKGDKTVYIKLKAKIDGYILAWNSNEGHSIPSKEQSLPLGTTNFQFVLNDPYFAFTDAVFSYVWSYGDGTIKNGSAIIMHDYESLGDKNVDLAITAMKNGQKYQNVIYKNISIRAPIKDLKVNAHSKSTKGVTVQFDITCKGSSPLSFCWYVARGNCELPSDVICSPTKLYHHCRNTINHTFNDSGYYCVNVTVTNTVSFAQKSINIQVTGGDPASKNHNHLGATAAAILPIIAGFLLLVAICMGVKYKLKYQRQIAKKTEVATFDFRSSQWSLNKRSIACNVACRGCCPLTIDCQSVCANEVEPEDDHELEERRKICDGTAPPESKVRYYGTIHRTLGQVPAPADDFVVLNEEESPIMSRSILSKSV